MSKKSLVVLTGAGISAESGIKTFRDSNGLWEEYDVMQVASIEGWHKDRELVLRFYNARRKQAQEAKPNAGHLGLVDLEKDFDVTIVTQNVDNLHEKAGSSKIIHLHGELLKVKSERNHNLIYECDKDVNIGDKAEDGSQLRPHVVWFGEEVPMMTKAAEVVSKADILAIIGTSLQVYPAAGLYSYTKPGTPVFLLDPNPSGLSYKISNLKLIKKTATGGIGELKKLLAQYI
jgi:NAD-dependent deacetylase